jgi:hypothetical protein
MGNSSSLKKLRLDLNSTLGEEIESTPAFGRIEYRDDHLNRVGHPIRFQRDSIFGITTLTQLSSPGSNWNSKANSSRVVRTGIM